MINEYLVNNNRLDFLIILNPLMNEISEIEKCEMQFAFVGYLINIFDPKELSAGHLLNQQQTKPKI